MTIESQMSLTDLASIERTYGIRLKLPRALRMKLDRFYAEAASQPRLPLGGAK